MKVKALKTLSGAFNLPFNTLYEDQYREKALSMSHEQYLIVKDLAGLLKVSEVTVRR